MAPEQDVPYEDELSMCGKIADDLRQMCWLFEDLRGFQFDLLSEPSTPEEKAWKIERKAIEKAEEAKHAALVKAEREEAKTEKARMKAESKMQED